MNVFFLLVCKSNCSLIFIQKKFQLNLMAMSTRIKCDTQCKNKILINYFSSLFFSAAQTQVNRNDIETPLKFVSENPRHVLASTLKNTPTYLNCHVSMKVDQRVAGELGRSDIGKFYNDQIENSDDDDDEDDVDDHPVASADEVRRYYDKQYEITLNHRNQSNVIPAPPVKPRTKRSAADTGLSYEWRRNDKTVIALSLGDNKPVNLDGFTLYNNGTLKFQASNTTIGEYRCKVKYTGKQARSYVIGPMISKATVVEVASELNKLFIKIFYVFQY